MLPSPTYSKSVSGPVTKNFTLILFLFWVGSISLVAQHKVESLEEFSRRREQEMQTFADQQKNEMDSMLSAQNRAFAKMLSGKWTRADLFPETKAYDKPKPEVPMMKETEVQATPEVIAIESLPENTEDAVDNEALTPQLNVGQEVDVPDEKPSESMEVSIHERYGEKIRLEDLTFFGNATWLPILKNWPLHKGDISAKSIENYWGECSRFDTVILLAYLAEQRKVLQLNAWASLQMIQQLSAKNFGDSVNQELFVWFMMIQLGYDVRLFYGNESVFVAATFQNKLYSRSYLEAGGKRYYLLSPRSGNRFITYPGEHENAMMAVSFDGLDSGVYPGDWKQRSFKFPFRDRDVSITLPFNSNRTEFYATVPQNDFDCYFENPGSDSFLDGLMLSLEPELSILQSNDDKIRFLYAMVCLGVEYETDAQQFGHEKYCMPEEFLVYPKADCEDRTFFLNYLFRNVLKLSTIGLVYPGHMAMAVVMENPPANAAIIRYYGKDYVFCDPTYIGAAVGDIPSQYQGVTPEIVE